MSLDFEAFTDILICFIWASSFGQTFDYHQYLALEKRKQTLNQKPLLALSRIQLPALGL